MDRLTPEIEYGGIKKKYPVLQKIFGDKFTSWVLLVRPATLLAPLLAGLFGVLAAVSFDAITAEHIKTAIYAGITLAAAQATGQVINQSADSELDKLAKPYRAIPRGAVSKDEAMGIAWLLAIFAIGRAFITGMGFGLIVLILIFFSVFYSLSPFSPRRVNPFLNIAWVSVSRGFLPVIAVFSIYGDINHAWVYAIFAFLYCLAYQGSKDIPDIDADRNFNIKTIPNTYGVKGFTKYAAAVSMLMYIYAFAYAPVMLLLVPLTILFFEGLEKENTRFENNRSWLVFYAGLGLIYIIMFVKESMAWL
ncbi:MAG: UbiA family prenyltransferase [Methanolobus sp.]|uniref:UbiA family prenyltransferase n=1 Tax=Methanolobus sp. TaxID=1874737 RepID=UPI00272FC4BA|nr:UbiA family prenyltransferase [Methanolobus sp.]MDP2217182.1 UbiA family prenyltransferase [Methanolobus sp.]